MREREGVIERERERGRAGGREKDSQRERLREREIVRGSDRERERGRGGGRDCERERERLTALLSVETPEMTNMSRKEMIISRTKDCMSDPTGFVPKKSDAFGLSNSYKAKLASMDPHSWAIT